LKAEADTPQGFIKRRSGTDKSGKKRAYPPNV
jgi:hypothetical protein